MSIAPADPAPRSDPLPTRLRVGAERLHQAMRRVVAHSHLPAESPSAVAEKLRVHRTLVSRLLSALRTEDALAAVRRMPRSEGLQMFLSAARSEADANEQVVAEALEAVSEFDSLVRGDLGGWGALDTAISEWLPEAREKFEISNRQLVFKGNSALCGSQVDVHAITAIYHPDARGERCDIAVITGLYGLRRLRPGTSIPVTALGPHPKDPRGGYPVEWLSDSVDAACPLLFAFSSHPPPDVEAVQLGQLTQYMLVGDEIGARSKADIVTAFVTRSLRPLWREPGDARQCVAVSAGIEVPAKALLLTVLLDERVFPGNEPELVAYDTHVRGVASPNDPARDTDRVETVDQVQSLGRGASRSRTAEIGRHVEQVQYVCERLGWDAQKLRGYRCRAPYPQRELQYVMTFDPPERPRAEED